MAGLKLVEETMQRTTPHTLNALQKLVMAMADFHNSRDKKTLFGRDKAQITYDKFLRVLRATIQAMIIDGVVQESTSSADVADELLSKLKTFALAFPNWQDAFDFASYFLIEQRQNAVATIERLRSSP